MPRKRQPKRFAKRKNTSFESAEKINWFSLIHDGDVEALEAARVRFPFPDPFVDGDSNSPLHMASIIGDIVMYEYLNEKIQQKGITTPERNLREKTCFLLAAEHGHLSLLSHLIIYPSNIEYLSLPSLLSHSSVDGNTSLLLASQNGHLHTAKYLIDKGADIDAANNYGETSLICASQYGHTEIAKYLIDKGASLHAATNNEKTSLILASQYGHIAIVKHLIDNGASIHATNNAGETSLIIAAQKSRIEIAKYLIDKGASIDAASNEGYTSIFYAIINENTKVVEYIMEIANKEWKKGRILEGERSFWKR